MFKWFWTIFSLGAPDTVAIPLHRSTILAKNHPNFLQNPAFDSLFHRHFSFSQYFWTAAFIWLQTSLYLTTRSFLTIWARNHHKNQRLRSLRDSVNCKSPETWCPSFLSMHVVKCELMLSYVIFADVKKLKILIFEFPRLKVKSFMLVIMLCLVLCFY